MMRRAAVAGRFYPGDPAELEHAVRTHVGKRAARDVSALIAPHAGYPYSGPVAGSAYRLLRRDFSRVLLLGPAHFYPFRGIAAHSAEAFETPLGPVPTEALAGVPVLDAAHHREHSLEVHLPFLQLSLDRFTVVPLVVGDATPDEVALVIETFGEGLIVVSSDLSHFHDYETARCLDRATADAIEALDHARIGPREACGCRPLGGLLEVARLRGWQIRTLDLRNSGDTAGGRMEVVGYGAFACG